MTYRIGKVAIGIVAAAAGAAAGHVANHWLGLRADPAIFIAAPVSIATALISKG